MATFGAFLFSFHACTRWLGMVEVISSRRTPVKTIVMISPLLYCIVIATAIAASLWLPLPLQTIVLMRDTSEILMLALAGRFHISPASDQASLQTWLVKMLLHQDADKAGYFESNFFVMWGWCCRWLFCFHWGPREDNNTIAITGTMLEPRNLAVGYIMWPYYIIKLDYYHFHNCLYSVPLPCPIPMPCPPWDIVLTPASFFSSSTVPFRELLFGFRLA